MVDRDERRIRRWNSKHPPIYEPGLNDILRIARDGVKESVSECGGSDSICRETASSESGSPCESHRMGGIKAAARQPNLVFTTDVAKCVSEADVVLIAVNTPTKKRGKGAGSATDMAAFEAVVALVAQHASPGAIIVEKSTVPCRTAQLVQDTVSPFLPFPRDDEGAFPTGRIYCSSRSTDRASPSKSSATRNFSRPARPSTISCTPTAS